MVSRNEVMSKLAGDHRQPRLSRAPTSHPRTLFADQRRAIGAANRDPPHASLVISPAVGGRPSVPRDQIWRPPDCRRFHLTRRAEAHHATPVRPHTAVSRVLRGLSSGRREIALDGEITAPDDRGITHIGPCACSLPLARRAYHIGLMLRFVH